MSVSDVEYPRDPVRELLDKYAAEGTFCWVGMGYEMRGGRLVKFRSCVHPNGRKEFFFADGTTRVEEPDG